MQISTILKLLGLLLILISFSFIPPLFVEYLYQDGAYLPFIQALELSLGSGLLLWLPFQRQHNELRLRDGFLIVVLFWLSLAIYSAGPFVLFPSMPTFTPLSFTDAFFESMSGITTTGATIFTDIDKLPHALLYYRQQLNFIGGMSVIILAIAIFPLLGVGGMALHRAENTSPTKDNKLIPRIQETAKALLGIYIGLTLLCGLLYWANGMSSFDALCYSFATVSTGGFSPHTANLGFYDIPMIQIIAVIFMFIGAINFNLHYYAFSRKNVRGYSHDPELRFFIIINFCIFFIVFALHYFLNSISNQKILDIIVTIVSSTTTTGLSSINLNSFPLAASMIILFGAIIGGCVGSTSGGIKIMRLQLLQKQAQREIHRLIHPDAHYIIKIGNKEVGRRIVEAVCGYCVIFIVIFVILFLLLLMAENDLLTAYTSLISCLSCSGMALGKTASNFSMLNDFSKWLLSFAMIAGRLEIFMLLVLCSPTFWRH